MPSTISELFAAAELKPEGCARWGQPVPERKTGVYVVSLTPETDEMAGTLSRCPLNDAALRELLSVRPELRMDDDKRPSAAELGARLAAFWLADEVALYIGRAGVPLRKRVGQYRRSRLGAESPHRGGWFLKTLSVLDDLWVHWSKTDDFVEAETTMLRAFAEGLDPASRAALHDPDRTAPFANIRTHDNTDKDHCITKPTGPLPKRNS